MTQPPYKHPGDFPADDVTQLGGIPSGQIPQIPPTAPPVSGGYPPQTGGFPSPPPGFGPGYVPVVVRPVPWTQILLGAIAVLGITNLFLGLAPGYKYESDTYSTSGSVVAVIESAIAVLGLAGAFSLTQLVPALRIARPSVFAASATFVGWIMSLLMLKELDDGNKLSVGWILVITFGTLQFLAALILVALEIAAQRPHPGTGFLGAPPQPGAGPAGTPTTGTQPPPPGSAGYSQPPTGPFGPPTFGPPPGQSYR